VDGLTGCDRDRDQRLLDALQLTIGDIVSPLTVRVWKKRPEHHAHSRSDIRDACGLPVATGAEL